MTEVEYRQKILELGVPEDELAYLKAESPNFTYQEIYQHYIDNPPKPKPKARKPKPASAFGDERTRFLWYPYLPIGDYTVLMLRHSGGCEPGADNAGRLQQ